LELPLSLSTPQISFAIVGNFSDDFSLPVPPYLLAISVGVSRQVPFLARRLAPATQNRISNRQKARLETHLTPAKSTRVPLLIAKKIALCISLFNIASMPLGEDECPRSSSSGFVILRRMIYWRNLLLAFRT
jgi:hypothetical protein